MTEKTKNIMKTAKSFALIAATALVAGWSTFASAAANLVVNGDFEAGNNNFTSGYTYAPASNTAESQYTVRSNPNPWNTSFISAPDHTPGTGTQMFVGNGSPSASIVWRSDAIAVSANTDYFFEAWVMNVCCNSSYTGENSASILEFLIDLGGGNFVSLGTKTTNLSLAGTWEFLSTTWNSGSNSSSIYLQLINRNTVRGGNDFAVDDITFSTESQFPTPVPEPGTLALLGLGLAGLAFTRRRKQ